MGASTIERLERAYKWLYGLLEEEELGAVINPVLVDIKSVLTELKTPLRWETPEQWKERTGKEWPNNAAVYYSTSAHGWYADTYSLARILSMTFSIQIICATEAGPPPDDWKPEEAR